MNAKQKEALRINSLRIAKSLSPIKTGNLRFNAIKTRKIHNGFQIYYDLSVAYYTLFLQYGTKRSTKWLGFIFPTTENAIIGYCISQKVGGKLKEANDIASQKRVVDMIKKQAGLGNAEAISKMEKRQINILRSKYINGEADAVKQMAEAKSLSIEELTGMKQETLDKYQEYYSELKNKYYDPLRVSVINSPPNK